MDIDDKEKSLKNRKNNLNNVQGKNMNDIASSIIQQNRNRNITTSSENILTTIQTNEINIENSTVIGTKLVETDNNDLRYLKAIKKKGEIAILKGENQLIEIIKLKSFEKILKLIGTKLKEFYYDISFGIYSCEEIVELRNNLNIDTNMKKDNRIKDIYNNNIELESCEKIEKISPWDDIIFDCVEKKINLLSNKEKNIINEDMSKIENKNNLINKEIITMKEEKIEKRIEGNNVDNYMINNINGETHSKMNKNENEENQKTIDKIGKNDKKFKFKNKEEEIKNKHPEISKKNKNNQIMKSQQKIKENKNCLKNKRQTILTKENKKIAKNVKFLQHTPIKSSYNKLNKVRNGSTLLKSKKYESLATHTEKSFPSFKRKIITKGISNIKNKLEKNNQKDMNIRTFNLNKYNGTENNNKMTVKDFYLLNKDRYNNITWDGKNDINNNNKKKEIKFQNNDNDLEIINQNKKCLKCGEIQDITKSKGIYLCENCKGFLCGKCSKMHYLKNPEHKCHYMKIQEENLFEKCKSSNNIFKDKLDFSLLKESKSTNIINNYRNEKLTNKQINFTKNCKLCNKSLLFNKTQIIFTNCISCKGNICESCHDIHLKKYKEHNLIRLMTVLIKDSINNDNYLIPKIYCGICGKQKNDSELIYYCDKCEIYFCEDCKNEYNIKHPEHNIFVFMRILIKEKNNDINKDEMFCRQCEKDLLENNYVCRKCEQCKIYLCLLCSESHLKKYKNHNIIYSIVKKNKNQLNTSLKSNKNCDNINDEIYIKSKYNNKYNSSGKRKKEVKIKLISQSLKKFNSNIYEDSNNKNESKNINCIHCNSRINDVNSLNYCFGYLCPSCSRNNTFKNIYNLNNFSEVKFIYKYILKRLSEKDNKNELDICNDCKNEINKNKKMVYYCIICKSKICNNCAEKYNNDNQEHILILLKD